MGVPRAVITNIVDSYDGLDSISGVPGYPAREYFATTERDFWWGPKFLESSHRIALEHAHRCGLRPTSNVRFTEHWRDLDPNESDRWLRSYECHPFICSYEMAEWAGWMPDRQQRAAATEWWESKVNTMRFCQSTKLPIAPTIFMEEVFAGRAFEGVGEEGLLLKLDYTASGLGMQIVHSTEEVMRWWAWSGKDFILQRKVSKVLELGVQLEIPQRGPPKIIKITGMHIGDSNDHEGNYFPFNALVDVPVDPDEMQAGVLRLARAMQQAGVQGRCGVDLMLTRDGSWVISEDNPRRTGATPFIDVADMLGAKAWSSKNMLTTARSLAELDLPHLNIAYTPEKGEGVIMMNWGAVYAGKAGMLIIAPPHKWGYYERESRAWLQSDRAEEAARAERACIS